MATLSLIVGEQPDPDDTGEMFALGLVPVGFAISTTYGLFKVADCRDERRHPLRPAPPEPPAAPPARTDPAALGHLLAP